jgi:hypothetical protein
MKSKLEVSLHVITAADLLRPQAFPQHKNPSVAPGKASGSPCCIPACLPQLLLPSLETPSSPVPSCSWMLSSCQQGACQHEIVDIDCKSLQKPSRCMDMSWMKSFKVCAACYGCQLGVDVQLTSREPQTLYGESVKDKTRVNAAGNKGDNDTRPL